MSIGADTLKQVIVGSGAVTAAQFENFQKIAAKKHADLEEVLLSEGVIDQNKLLEIKGDLLGVPVVDLHKEKIPQNILDLVPEPIARRHNVIAFNKEGDELHMAMLDPDDLQIREFIKKTSGLNIRPFLTTKDSISYGLSLYHTNIEEEFKKILGKGNLKNGLLQGIQGDTMDEKLASIAEQIPVVRIVDTLVDYASYENASDVHIEPQEKNVSVRYRIDGILHDVMQLPKIVLPAVVARIKVLANLKIDEHRLPQDGRFKKEIGERKIAFRVSIIPIFDGEKVVMRLLNESAKARNLEELGFRGTGLEVIQRNLKKPNGATLVTGPTGSGKSTTLYSMLTQLNTRKVNISTIEDPIEYRLPGANQMQVNPKIGLTFAAGLRALLRQDPNIIMIGEIRDKETAEEAVHAAMTGHLVLSTLHTNSAAGSLPRLLDMGVEPFLIASTINTIVAQRLVRTLCKSCMKSRNLTEKELKELGKQFDLEILMKIMKREQILADDVKDWSEVLFFESTGCDRCNKTGYKGRSGIYEILDVTPEIQDLIMERAAAGDIQKLGVDQGMVLLWQDGFIKAHLGETSIAEVLRVSKE